MSKKTIDVIAESENVKVVKARPKYATEEIAETVWDKDDQIGHTVPNLPELAEIQGFLEIEVAEWRLLEKEASIRALKIGVLIVRARKDLKHGEYMPWIRANVPFDQKTTWRFTSMAEIFLQQKKLTIEEAYEAFVQHQNLVEGMSASKPVQLAFDFVGKSSFRELCDKIGHPVAKRGGDHGGGAARAAQAAGKDKDALLKAEAEQEWDLIVKQLQRFVRLEKSFVRLERHSLIIGISTLKDCLKTLTTELKQRKNPYNKG